MKSRMTLKEITFQNYKSLRNVTTRFPDGVTALVGPNNAGKSNLCEGVDFVARIYRTGLAEAVQGNGGLDGFLSQMPKRRADSLSISVLGEFLHRIPLRGAKAATDAGRLIIRHSFVLEPSSDVDSDVLVASEDIEIGVNFPTEYVELLRLARTRANVRVAVNRVNRASSIKIPWRKQLQQLTSVASSVGKMGAILASDDLIALTLGKLAPLMATYITTMSATRIYQLDPEISREDGETESRPEMTYFGANLPSVLNYLRTKHRNAWESILGVMRSVVPDLDDVVVQDSATGNLAIYFKEHGYGRAWNASEVSDGTVRTLALAAAIFDPRIPLLILEEPENSVHPWIARTIADACIDAAKEKQLIVTTHSAIVMNAFAPASIVLVWRDKKGTHTKPLREMNTAVRKVLDSGNMDVFDVLTGGAIAEAIPHPPISALSIIRE